MDRGWTQEVRDQAEVRAEADPLIRAALVEIERLHELAHALRRELADYDAVERARREIRESIRRLAQELRVEAATEWARGEKVACDTFEQAAERLQAVL